MSDIEEQKLDLKLKEGHAVGFDFDGVIHKYSKGWQDGRIYDEANPQVLDLMLFLQKVGIPVFICSARKPEQIINWWNKQGFWTEAAKIGDKVTFYNNLNIIGVTNRKLPAQLYIDDRAYKYTGQTVKQFILDHLEKLEDYNKEDIEMLEEFTKLDIIYPSKLVLSKTQYNLLKEGILNILEERKQDKKKIKELEAKLEFKKYGDLDNTQFEEYMIQFIPKQKITYDI